MRVRWKSHTQTVWWGSDQDSFVVVFLTSSLVLIGSVLCALLSQLQKSLYTVNNFITIFSWYYYTLLHEARSPDQQSFSLVYTTLCVCALKILILPFLDIKILPSSFLANTRHISHLFHVKYFIYFPVGYCGRWFLNSSKYCFRLTSIH